MTTEKIQERLREVLPPVYKGSDVELILVQTLTTLLAEQKETVVQGLEGLKVHQPELTDLSMMGIGLHNNALEAALTFVREQV